MSFCFVLWGFFFFFLLSHPFINALSYGFVFSIFTHQYDLNLKAKKKKKFQDKKEYKTKILS